MAKIVRAGADPKDFLAKYLQRDTASRTPPPTLSPEEGTVADYYAHWVVDQTPPLVRKGQARDYRRHIGGYVLPALGPLPLTEVTHRHVRALQTRLLSAGRRVKAGEPPAGLGVKYVRNILSGSARAMFQQAVRDELIVTNPCTGLKYPEWDIPEPDPFTSNERDRILAWFYDKRFGFRPGRRADQGGEGFRPHPPYYAYVHLLFWSGMRPSEASGLQWTNIDLAHSRLYVRFSYHLGAYGKPKTKAAKRTVQLFPRTLQLLRAIQPLRVTPTTPVFTSTTGGPIEPNSLLPHWYAAQRALGIRVRGLYAMKDTFVTTALERMRKRGEWDFQWLEQQTGVAYATLRRHYAKWFPDADQDALQRFAADDPTLFQEGPIVTAIPVSR